MKHKLKTKDIINIMAYVDKDPSYLLDSSQKARVERLISYNLEAREAFEAFKYTAIILPHCYCNILDKLNN